MRTSERVQAAIECTSVAYISALNNMGFRHHHKWLSKGRYLRGQPFVVVSENIVNVISYYRG